MSNSDIYAIILGESLPTRSKPGDRAFEHSLPDGAHVRRLLGLPPGLHARQGEWSRNMWREPLAHAEFKRKMREIALEFRREFLDPRNGLFHARQARSGVSVLCTSAAVRQCLARALRINENSIPYLMQSTPVDYRWDNGSTWKIAAMRRPEIRYHKEGGPEQKAVRNFLSLHSRTKVPRFA